MWERLKYIDGIKGIACFLVFVHHFLLAFYIAYFTGNPAESHMNSQIDVKMAQSPVSVVVNGQFWVCMFILVSSFLAAKQIFSTNNMERVAGSIWKRYFRLMLPMLVIGIITWAMHTKGMFTNQEVAQVTGSWWLEAYFEQPLSLKEMLYTVLYDVWMGDVEASVQISHAFWMMTYLLVGYYMVVLLTFVVKHTTKWSYCLLVLAAGIAFKYGHYYYLTVIAGVWLADLSRSIQENKVKNWYHHVTCVVLLLVGGVSWRISQWSSANESLCKATIRSNNKCLYCLSCISSNNCIWCVTLLETISKILLLKTLLHVGNIVL